LTGGIGSGKSTVARMLTDHGAALIDADAISRATTAAGGAAIAAIAAQFGLDAINANGALNRDVMRQRVFDDPTVKKQLEAIVHPLVYQESARQVDLAQQAGVAWVVFDIPLLVESKRWRQQLDKVLVLDCEEATQISRVMTRESTQHGDSQGWTRDAVEKVIAQQASRAQRRAAADWVIYNDGLDLTHLAEQVQKMAGRITL
jgi:dephospho-CoA kinase